MRAGTVIAVLLLGGAATLEAQAQHHFQFEVGGFASFTRFDRAFELDNQIGGGGRIGFWITDLLGIEGEGLYRGPPSKYVGGYFACANGRGRTLPDMTPLQRKSVLGGLAGVEVKIEAPRGAL